MHPVENTEGKPQALILPTKELLSRFNNSGFQLVSEDVVEVLTQIFMLLLNSENASLAYFDSIPEFHRLRDSKYLSDNQARLVLEKASRELACSLHDMLSSFGVYEQNTFSYYFTKLLDGDIVLSRLPY